ncbi:hypothetical protein RIF25_02855 [Thermosynechococcaceae cyanobacterium BACA0444]|uniref:Uncharacterized protein n=1 Tax=Pseudocalidococcus azoricus BACA0444 TaxID=2918990 RepID=A0AAE4FPJ1_9CYAN|nr:hypothetical protein [Pseudocalidococcus azoricus]MDS3859741.1 hypothetical protein [Pseudocalidococcus azoricus BACA0444]
MKFQQSLSLVLGLASLTLAPAALAQQADPLQGWQEGQKSNDIGGLLNGGGQGGSLSLPSLMNQIRNMDARSYSEVAQDQMENLNSEAAQFRLRQQQLQNQTQPAITPAP